MHAIPSPPLTLLLRTEFGEKSILSTHSNQWFRCDCFATSCHNEVMCVGGCEQPSAYNVWREPNGDHALGSIAVMTLLYRSLKEINSVCGCEAIIHIDMTYGHCANGSILRLQCLKRSQPSPHIWGNTGECIVVQPPASNAMEWCISQSLINNCNQWNAAQAYERRECWKMSCLTSTGGHSNQQKRPSRWRWFDCCTMTWKYWHVCMCTS